MGNAASNRTTDHTTPPARRRWLLTAAAAVLGVSAIAPAADADQSAAAGGAVAAASRQAPTRAAALADVYQLVNRCYALRDATTGRFVVKDALGYAVSAPSPATATRFRFQATGLGSYLLYGSDRTMPAALPALLVAATETPGPAADWRLSLVDQKLAFTNVSTGSGLGVTLGRLSQEAEATPRFTVVATSRCAKFPDVELNVTGTPAKGASPTAPVRGFLDDHLHISAFQFLGGRFHCGRPWSPYGVTVALQDCSDHEPNGATAVFENFLATGSPIGTHSTGGWPSFAGWPRSESLTHEGTYWRWIERAWRSGLRIIVNDVVENRALCELYPLKQNDCDEMASARQQVRDMYDMQDYIDAQFGGPGKGFFRIVTSSTEARRVINDGKLAIVLGMETSEVLGCGKFRGRPNCGRAKINRELDDFHRLGIRSLFPVHKFDNALGGTHFDEGATGLLVNTGNKYATGEFWVAEHCDAEDHDNEPTNLAGENADLIAGLLGAATGDLLDGELPVYPSGPLCNPKGLTDLGRHLLKAMMAKGMIIETDHMSVKARRQALSILESKRYSGLITSHSWGDAGSQRRLQALGGVVGPYAGDSTTFVEGWQEARANINPGPLFGIGYGSDTNGLGAQGGPRPGASANPVRYPLRSFDGSALIGRQRSGTRVYDINVDGVDHYGLYPDWIEDLRMIAGDQVVDDLANGAEAYLQMWARAEAAATE